MKSTEEHNRHLLKKIALMYNFLDVHNLSNVYGTVSFYSIFRNSKKRFHIDNDEESIQFSVGYPYTQRPYNFYFDYYYFEPLNLIIVRAKILYLLENLESYGD